MVDSHSFLLGELSNFPFEQTDLSDFWVRCKLRASKCFSIREKINQTMIIKLIDSRSFAWTEFL